MGTNDVEINVSTDEWKGGGWCDRRLCFSRYLYSVDGWIVASKDCQAPDPKGSTVSIPCCHVCLSSSLNRRTSFVIITTHSTAFTTAHAPRSIVPENDDNGDLSKLVSAGSLEPWASTRADEVASGSPSYFLQLRRQGRKIVSGSPQLTTGQYETLSPTATGDNKSHFLKQLHHAAATQAQMVTGAPATSCRDNRRCSRQKKLPTEEKKKKKKLTCSCYRL